LALQSKFLVYAAIAGMLGLLGAVIWYASLDNPDLEQVEIELTNVELISVNKVENSAKLQITFLVKNPSEKTFTVPLIAYQLYADGVLLGSGQYSTADIAMPGRAIFNSGAEIPLQNIFDVKGSEIENEIYQSIIDDKVVSFKVDGVITAESAWSLIEKEFESSI
jgi:LEA14-like dessication related protein